LRDHPLALAFILIGVNALSVLDFVFTRAQLQAGIAIEANPVLANLFATNGNGALLFKITVMSSVSLGIWLARKHRAILSVALGALIAYLALIAYHIAGMTVCGGL
jgi:CHASE2 domain-containing sensor protein